MTHKFSYDERGSEVKYVQEFNMYLSFIKFSFVSPMKRIFSRMNILATVKITLNPAPLLEFAIQRIQIRFLYMDVVEF